MADLLQNRRQTEDDTRPGSGTKTVPKVARLDRHRAPFETKEQNHCVAYGFAFIDKQRAPINYFMAQFALSRHGNFE